MGGHAFHLYTPRISRELYLQIKQQCMKQLHQLFTHVTVPTEMPSKIDYGDVDFLVAGSLRLPSSSGPFDYPSHVSAIKVLFHTRHGFRGHKEKQVMYFTIPAPGREGEFFIQVDVKVCEDVDRWAWECFELYYASAAKMLGSMIKPLGLTTNLDGLFLRVDGLDKVNAEKSMVFLTREPKDVLRVVGLDRRILSAGFRENDECELCWV
jgi:hypothetical protein